MTDSTAKLTALALVLDWQSRSIWAVRCAQSENMTTFRWFRSEASARRYAALCHNATVEYHSSPSPCTFDDELLTIREQMILALAAGVARMRDLEYTHEHARG